MAPQSFTRSLGQAIMRDGNSSLSYQEIPHSQRVTQSGTRSYILLDLRDTQSRSFNFHQYSGQDATRGPHAPQQNNVWWLLEIISCLASMACIITITIALKVYNGRPIPEWPLGLTLNSFVAFLTSIAKLFLLVPVMECIGQLRWMWFSKKPRPLADFEMFEQACRGAFGSLRLLVTFKGGVLCFLGAFITVLSLFTSPMTQQVIRYPSQLSPVNGTASVARLTIMSQNTSSLGKQRHYLFASWERDINDVIMDVKQHVMSAAYALPTTEWPALAPNCSTGECTFADFPSLGVCAKVANISKSLTVERLADRDWNLDGFQGNSTYSATLPNNLSLIAPNLKSFIYAEDGQAASLSFSGNEVNLQIINPYIIFTNPAYTPNDNMTFEAIEVLFYWCAKAFSVSMSDNLPRTQVLATSTNFTSNMTTTTGTVNAADNPMYLACLFGVAAEACDAYKWGQLTLQPPPGIENGSQLVVDGLTGLGFSALLQTASTWGGNTPNPVGGSFLQANGTYRVQGDISFALGSALWRNANIPVDPSVQFDTLQNFTRNMANGMENMIRGWWVSSPESDGPVSGIALNSTPYVQIEWPWLAFLASEFFMASAILLATIMVTRREKMQVMKASSLATMCALDDTTRCHLGGASDFRGMCRRAAMTRVSLEGGGSGLKVWLTMGQQGRRPSWI